MQAKFQSLSTLIGNYNVECEEWIRSIQEEAFAQGKTTEKTWMAALASSRIGGSALRWYRAQSEDIVLDWFRLRATLLDEYGPESTGPQPIGQSYKCL